MKGSSLKRIAYGLTTIFAAAGLVLGVIKVLESPYFSVKKVEIFTDVVLKNKTPLNDELIRELASVPLGENLFSLDLGLIAARVQNHDWVQEVVVSTHLPDRVEIRVEAKKPIAIAHAEKNRLQYVDASAKIFGDFDPNRSGDLPLLSDVPEEKMKDAVSYLDRWNNHSVQKLAELSGIGFSDEHGFQAYVVIKGSLQRSALLLGENKAPEIFDEVEKTMQYVNQNHIAVRQIRADVSKKIVVKIARGS